MKVLLILVVSCISLIQCEPPKRQYINSNFQTKSKVPLRTLMLQFRNGGRPTLHIKAPHILTQRLRPHKHVPYQLLKNQNGGMVKRPSINYISSKPFHSSQPGPHTGEYVFENPFANLQASKQTTVKPIQTIQMSSNRPLENSIRFTIDNQGPIHTIPAPNLASFGGGKIQQIADFTYPHDNHISLTDGGASVFHTYSTNSPFTVTPVPVRYHQYQVTEDTNDHTMHDPFSGIHKLYAPDPDPTLPARGVSPSHDPFNKPSNGNSLPFDVAASASLNQQLFQFIDPIPQQQLPDSYGLPINNQPQLQQHLLQQASLVPSMPLSVYNPTYLVTQSNNLFNQHQQQQQQHQLFKPESSFLTAYNQPTFSKPYQPTFGYQNQDLQGGGFQHVASPGQLYASAQDQEPFLAAASQNIQAIAQYIDQPSQRPKTHQLTTEEYQNLLDRQKLHDIESTPYPYEYTSQQQQNDEMIKQANQEALQNQFYHSTPASSTAASSSATSSIHNQHQSLLAQQFSTSLSPMRIYVPDDDTGYQKIQQRSDDDEDASYDSLSTSSEETMEETKNHRNLSNEVASSENKKDEQPNSS